MATNKKTTKATLIAANDNTTHEECVEFKATVPGTATKWAKFKDWAMQNRGTIGYGAGMFVACLLWYAVSHLPA